MDTAIYHAFYRPKRMRARDALAIAIDTFTEKFGSEPDRALVHPSAYDEMHDAAPESLGIERSDYVQPHDFYLGRSDA